MLGVGGRARWALQRGCGGCLSAVLGRSRRVWSGEPCMGKLRFSLALAVALAGPFGRQSAAQETPDFWDVATAAAAGAVIAKNPQGAALMLGAAHAAAKGREPDGVRPILARVQLMLAYVELERYELFKSAFGAEKINIDASKFDASLKLYAGTASRLANNCYERNRDPNDAARANALRREGIEFCFRN